MMARLLGDKILDRIHLRPLYSRTTLIPPRVQRIPSPYATLAACGRGGRYAPNTLNPCLQAKAGLLLQAAVHRVRPDLKPLGCGVNERGFHCDFKPTRGEWLKEDEARRAAEEAVSLAGVRVEALPGRPSDPLAVELGRTKTFLVDGIEAYLEPGVEPAGNVGAVAVLGVSAHNPLPGISLVRVSAVAFETAEALEEYLRRLEEVERRDHRAIGKRLGLFAFYEEAGPGLVVFHPKGFIVREELIKLVREVNAKLGYEEVYTPHVYRALVWIRSGHYEHYKDKMILAKIEGEEYGVKPMNCPGHILIYKSEPRSYRDLPVRFSEFGTVYRWEKRGELYGLLRVRGFTQDDGHSFLREDQVKEEVKRILRAVQELLAIFGFRGEDVRFNLSTRPDEYIGSEEMWEKATRALREALEELQLPYIVREKEGAFYGPKIDVEFRDSLGRWWQCSTIQVDFALPERFNLEYTMPDGSKARPVVVHRALLGSIERFMAILLEHFEGKLPTWLSPVQVVVLPTSDKYADYARKVVSKLRGLGLRVELWTAEETLGRRIKRAYDMAVPYIVVVGGREAETGSVSIRGRGNLRVDSVPLEEFADLLAKEVSSRSLNQEALLSLMAKRGLKVERPGGPDASASREVGGRRA